MVRNTFKADLVLEGYQAIMKPSKFGYSLAGLLDADVWKPLLELERKNSLIWIEHYLKNQKNICLKPEPWEDVEPAKLKVKFVWNDASKPYVMDAGCEPITDLDLPLFSGCKVSIAFYQKPYVLRDGITCGTSLKLIGIQVLEVQDKMIDCGYNTFDDVAKLFGKRKGFKLSTC